MSFSKTLTGHSPIPVRNFDNKSSIDDGTRSLIGHMRGNSGDYYNGTYQFKNATLGGIASGNQTKTNFVISAQSTAGGGNATSSNSPFLRFAGNHTQNRMSNEKMNHQR